MKTLNRAQRRIQKKTLNRAERRIKYSRPEVLDLAISRRAVYGNPEIPIPLRITFLRFDAEKSTQDQLFIDQLPVPREAWSYDPLDRILRWKGAFGGGQLHLFRDKPGAIGNIGPALNPCSVLGGSRAQFLCAVALDCGVSYVNSGGEAVNLSWDTTSPKWQNAEWIANRLLLTYTVTQGDPMAPPAFTFEFQDKETCAIAWNPAVGSFVAALELGEQGSSMVWDLTFKSQAIPLPDKGLHPATGPDSVYPYWLQAEEDSAAYTINGAMEIDDLAPNGTLIGITGVRPMPQAAGYYRTTAQAAPFGIFDGQIVIDGKKVEGSYMLGRRLYWRGLDPLYQKMTGLPGEGSLHFRSDGSYAQEPGQGLKIHRMDAHTAALGVAEYPDLHQDLSRQMQSLSLELASNPLTITDLMTMTPFKFQNNCWGDVVQNSVMQDFYTIMNSYIPDDIWDLLFPDTPRPELTGELAEVAHSPVPGVADPAAWYQSLGTAVVTQQIAGGTDKNCENLNGPRAVAWLKQQVAGSPVYHTHGQELFQYEWQELYPEINDYKNDQIINAAAYESGINGKREAAIEDINENVIVDVNSPPDLKQGLIDEVNAAADYALVNNLYWAFAFYVYNTTPSILSNVAIQLGISTGSADGTTLSRLFQTNVTVLTALDPSGYFARQYNNTFNTYLAANILPSMYGFTGDADNFDIIYMYFQTFVENNLDNADQAIAQAAAEINQMMQDENFEAMLQASIEAVNAIAASIQETLALPFISEKFLGWFEKNYPKSCKVGKLFSGLFMCALGGLAIFNLVTCYTNWDDLSDGEKSEVIYATVQLGLQIVGAIVKRGVRIAAIFTVDGMSAMQRLGAVAKIAFRGEAEVLNEGLVNISNSTARWLGNITGTGEMTADEEIYLLMNIGENDIRRVSFTEKVFGRNLDEFISTRIGPVLILASIGLSIYFAVTADSVCSLVADIANIVAGALMLFGMVGRWAIAGGFIAAEGIMSSIIAFAGPLAIVAALAGVALMIAQMFIKPPDPVETFVDDYARPAGFYVEGKCSAIDYAVHYANPDQGQLMMMGSSLISGGLCLCCNPDGSIGSKQPTALPECVWQVVTDGLGMSQFYTVALPEGGTMPVPLYLSYMSDRTITFQPEMGEPEASAEEGSVTVISQTWLTTPVGKAELTSDKNFLAALNIKLQPVVPDHNGLYSPANACGFLKFNGSSLVWSSSSVDGSTMFTLAVSGMAPNFMTMSNLSFISGMIPSSQETYGPLFGINPSTPVTYINSGDPLPSFLTFSTETGCYKPNGRDKAQPEGTQQNSVSAGNLLGSGFANFTISIGKTM